jgi:hypothetical protein
MSAVQIPQTPEEWAAWTAEVQRSIESAREAGREGILARMGYRSYEEYRQSYLWRKIKKRAFAKYDGKCVRCGGRAYHVHHRSYTEAVLKGEDDDQLRPLCSGCHHIVEYDDNGSWRSETEKERVLFETEIPLHYPRPILHKNGRKVLNPPNFQRMNDRQRSAWWNEFHFLASIHRSPDLALKNPEAYARLSASYQATKQYGIDVPLPPKLRRKRKKAAT